MLNKQKELMDLKEKSIQSLWLEDLDELENAVVKKNQVFEEMLLSETQMQKTVKRKKRERGQVSLVVSPKKRRIR